MEPADRHRALTEETQRHPVVFAVLARERDASRQRDVPADDAVPTEHVVLRVEQVHRTAEPLGATGDLAVKLGHHAFARHPLGEGEPVIAVGADHVVVGLQGGAGADCHGFLADVEVEKAADLALRVSASASSSQRRMRNIWR